MDIVQSMRDKNIGIQEAIRREKAKREVEGRVCNYLVMSEPIYGLLRVALEGRALFSAVNEDIDVEIFDGMEIVRLDRVDYTLIIG